MPMCNLKHGEKYENELHDDTIQLVKILVIWDHKVHDIMALLYEPWMVKGLKDEGAKLIVI
jgi:hypothetical protein